MNDWIKVRDTMCPVMDFDMLVDIKAPGFSPTVYRQRAGDVHWHNLYRNGGSYRLDTPMVKEEDKAPKGCGVCGSALPHVHNMGGAKHYYGGTIDESTPIPKFDYKGAASPKRTDFATWERATLEKFAREAADENKVLRERLFELENRK